MYCLQLILALKIHCIMSVIILPCEITLLFLITSAVSLTRIKVQFLPWINSDGIGGKSVSMRDHVIFQH